MHETEALNEETVNETGCRKSGEPDKDEEAQVDENNLQVRKKGTCSGRYILFRCTIYLS